MTSLRNPLRTIKGGFTLIRPAPVLVGKALERRFARAARENRKSELNELAAMGEALTVRSLLAATGRIRPNNRDVPVSRTVIELAYRWRDSKGQTLGSDIALHIAKKLLNEQIDDLVAGEIAVRKPSEERGEALTQLLSIVEPQLRVAVHAHLLSHLNERALMEHTAPTMYAGDESRSREELEATVKHRVRRIELGGFGFIGKAAIHASAFDGIEAGYEQQYQPGVA